MPGVAGRLRKIAVHRGLGGNTTRITSLHTGQHHALLLSGAGVLFVMGRNDCGQLGCGLPAAASVQSPVVLEDFLRSGDVLVACGAGARHSATLTENGKLYTWGDGSSGQLGLGSARSQRRPVLVQLCSGVSVCLCVCVSLPCLALPCLALPCLALPFAVPILRNPRSCLLPCPRRCHGGRGVWQQPHGCA